MPRKSRAQRAIEPFVQPAAPVPVQPPASLSPAARAAFVALVASCEPEHFENCDVSLIARYAVAQNMAERAEALLEIDPTNSKALALWEKSTRAMSGLALRLRIGPQSRRDRAKAPKELSWSDRFALEQQYERS